VAIDPVIQEATIMRPPKNSLNIWIVEFAVCAVAPSC
jgi:hypothetical protein